MTLDRNDERCKKKWDRYNEDCNSLKPVECHSYFTIVENLATFSNKNDNVGNQKQYHWASVCTSLAFVEVSGVVVGFYGYQNKDRNRCEKLNNICVEK